MKKRYLLAALTAGAIGLVAPPGTSAARQHHTGAGAKASTNAEFMKKAAQANMAEVALGQIALQRAESPDVKQFGQRMIDDHTKANDELAEVASKEGVTLPKDVGAKHRAEADAMAKLSGAEFDRAYIRHMVNDHVQDVALFERESSRTKDADLKAWVDETLPTLKEHRHMAQETAAKVGAGTVHGSASGQLHQGGMGHGSQHQGEATR